MSSYSEYHKASYEKKKEASEISYKEILEILDCMKIQKKVLEKDFAEICKMEKNSLDEIEKYNIEFKIKSDEINTLSNIISKLERADYLKIKSED